MPKVGSTGVSCGSVAVRQLADVGLRGALSPTQVATLGLLAGGACLTSGKLTDAGGSVGAANTLLRMGLVAREALDLDGVTEHSWTATDAGVAAYALAAPTGKKAERRKGGAGSGSDAPAIGSIAPWFGAARRTACTYGEAFRGIAWVGVPYCGSLAEIPAMLAAGVNAIACNDMHRHLINLARTMADTVEGPKLYRRLRRQPFSLETLRVSQQWCQRNDPISGEDGVDALCAFHYFIAAWMARSANAGTSGELKSGLSIRYGYGGGSSTLRYANAVGGIRAWRRILARCSFSSDDAMEFLARCNDRDDGGVYADPPWPGVGKAYLHGDAAGDGHQRALAAALGRFTKARVVLRTGGGALHEELYPRSTWQWLEVGGRDQANAEKCEYLVRRR